MTWYYTWNNVATAKRRFCYHNFSWCDMPLSSGLRKSIWPSQMLVVKSEANGVRLCECSWQSGWYARHAVFRYAHMMTGNSGEQFFPLTFVEYLPLCPHCWDWSNLGSVACTIYCSWTTKRNSDCFAFGCQRAYLQISAIAGQLSLA